ncbi:DUF4912 domain-containing protein [Bacillus infantis]|nr:DUF4912 domain-containing protein [Bacillus infantis]
MRSLWGRMFSDNMRVIRRAGRAYNGRLAGRRCTMQSEIIRLREKGLSFRNIAKELGTTRGKVQYQWMKHLKETEEKEDEKEQKQSVTEAGRLPPDCLMKEEGIAAWQVQDGCIYSFWRTAAMKKSLAASYFEVHVSELEDAIRLYDITSIIFNGSNAHSIQEHILAEGQNSSIFKNLAPDRSYCIEAGARIRGRFIPFMRSNSVQIPRNSEAQAGRLMEDLKAHENGSPPNWIEHVSTYSFYTNEKGGV